MEFLILPDNEAGELVARSIGSERAEIEVVAHASGRPWIVGRWADGDVTWAASGQRRVAVLGRAAVSPARLAGALDRARDLKDLDGLARALPGSFHLAASVDGRVRAQGTVSTTCQIFHTKVNGTTVAADRPQSLAALAGAGIAEELVALRLLAPWSPWPLSEYCLWHGVEALPTGCYLEMDPGGDGRAVRWWTPPEPDVPLSVGAGMVRSALQEAVAARMAAGGRVSADLSGGMDSTSLCYLAYGAPEAPGASRASRMQGAPGSAVPLLTTRWEATDPTDDDGVWAGRAAAELPGAEHLLMPRQEAPPWFADITELDPDVEAPFAWIRTRARLVHQARLLAAHGSTQHLTGHGGDELFFATALHLHTLVRTQPSQAMRHIRAYRALYRWKLGPTLRGLSDNAPFGEWLAASADSLTDPVRMLSGRPDFGWWIGFRMPQWATPEAVEAVGALLRQAAASDPEPLSPLRAQHAALQDVRQCGDAIRRVNRLTSRHGVSWEAPYVDDRVVEAALSIRLEDCASPEHYKPALTAAMRGIVPDPILGRRTKGEYSAEAYAGLREHRPALLELCDDMRLAQLGLVDSDAFRSALLGLHTSSLTMFPLINTLGCELWLRSAFAAGTPSTGGLPCHSPLLHT